MISIVIPVRNEERYIGACLSAIARQGNTGHEIDVIVIDSESDDRTAAIAAEHGATVHSIPAADFRHGRTRNLGASMSRGEIIVFLNGDAEPVGDDWLEKLIAPLARENVVAAYSRQAPRPDANGWEASLIRRLYPEQPAMWTEARSGQGLWVVFSTVAAAVGRETWERLPFDDEIEIAEDQLWAEEMLRSGRAIHYVPDSVVLHSHNYGYRDCVARYRQLGRVRSTRVSAVSAPKLDLSSVFALAGLAVRDVLGELRRGRVLSALRAAAASAARFAGYALGIVDARLRR